jgi:hypothetical protein
MKKQILFVLIVCLAIASVAQNTFNMIDILNVREEFNRLESYIMSSIENDPEMITIRGLRQFHIFELSCSCNSLKQEDYLNYSFLNYLGSIYSIPSGKGDKDKEKPQHHIAATTLVTDSTGNLVAIDYVAISKYKQFNSSFAARCEKLAKMFFENEIDFAFSISLHGDCIYLKGNKLYVLPRKDTNVYTWEEFIDCCFDEFQGFTQTLQWEDRNEAIQKLYRSFKFYEERLTDKRYYKSKYSKISGMSRIEYWQTKFGNKRMVKERKKRYEIQYMQLKTVYDSCLTVNDTAMALVFKDTNQILEWGKTLILNNIPSKTIRTDKFRIQDNGIFILQIASCGGKCPDIYIFKEEKEGWHLVTSTYARLREQLSIRIDNEQETMIFETKVRKIGELTFDILLK